MILNTINDYVGDGIFGICHKNGGISLHGAIFR